MAFCRASFTFGLQHLQSVDDGGTGVFRLDYDVYHAAHCCLVRSCKVIDIFFRFCFYIRIIFEDDVSCTCRSHYCDFCSRPCNYLVCAQILGTHCQVGTTVCFTGYYSNFRYSCFGICIQHFCAVTDNTAVFLVAARQEARNVNQVQQRNTESVAEADETSGFIGSVDIQAASHNFRLVSNDTYGLTIHTSEASDDVGCPVFLVFIEFAVIYDRSDYIIHIVSLVGVVRQQSVQAVVHVPERYSDNIGDAKTISFSIEGTTTTGAEALGKAVQAINEQSSKTGVVASLNKDATGIVLTNASGNTIAVGKTASANAGTVTVQKLVGDGKGDTTTSGGAQTLAAASVAAGAEYATAVSGYITLDSDKSFSAVSTTTTALQGTPATLNSDLKRVSDLDISNFGKATHSLKTVDSALQYISSERAKLGALQSRFETAIAALQITSENMSASRSRIQDADFAAETANLSRTQILQQAGTAMVAQANQIPQGVLALLNN